MRPLLSLKSFSYFLILLLILQLSIGLFALPVNQAKASGTTYYYVDNSCASNGNGLAQTCASSPGGAGPFNSIANMEAKSGGYAPGDQILLKGGDTFRESLAPHSSGTSGNPITFGSYGTGQAIINGSTLVSGWSNVAQTTQFSDNFNSGNTQGWIAIGSGVSFTSGQVDVVVSNTNGTHRIDSPVIAGGNEVWSTYQVYFAVASTTSGFISGLYNATSKNPIAAVGIASYSGTLYWQGYYSTNSWEYADTGPSNPIPVSTGVWHTIEVYTKFSASGGGIFAYWVDGTLMAEETGLTNNNESVSQVTLGENYSPSAETVTAYYDNLFVYTGAGSPNVWTAPFSASVTPSMLFTNGVLGAEQSDGALANNGDWAFASSTLYLLSTTNPNTLNSPGVEVNGNGVQPIYLDNENYITLNNLETTHATWNGINLENSTNILINGVNSSYNYLQGVNNVGDSISGNIVADNGWQNVTSFNTAGIEIWGDYKADNDGGTAPSYNVTIQNNEVYNIPSPTPSQLNVGTGATGIGIWLDQWGAGGVVRYNKIYDNSGPGITLSKHSGSVAYGNVLYNNVSTTTYNFDLPYPTEAAQLQIVGDASNMLVYNNTCYGGITCYGVQGQPGSSAMVNNTLENNIAFGYSGQALSAEYGGENANGGSGNVYFYNDFGPASSSFIQWSTSTYYSTYASWELAYCGSTGCSHSIQSNPLLINTSTDNFALQSSSPAIGSGLNLGSTYEYALDPASTWPSNIMLDNQNSYGSGWDLGAYVYTQTSTPSVSMTAPTASSTVSGIISVSASSSAVSPASVASVQFYLDGSPLGSAVTSSPYTISWNTATTTNASHTLYALATDNYSNTATSTSLTVTVANQAVLSVPTSTLSFSAVHGSIATSSQSVVVKNTGATSTTLNWSATSTETWLTFSPTSGSLAGNATTSVSFIVNPATLALGIYNATATVSDPNASSSPQTIPVTLTISSTGVSATITTPVDGTILSGTASITASATSTAGIASLSLLIDGLPVASTTASSLSYSWDTTGALNGTHAISLLATDTYNNSASSSISVTVANAATPTTPSPVVEVAAGGGGGGTGYTPPPVTTTSTPPATINTTISTSSLQAEIDTLLAELQTLEARAGITTNASSLYVFTRNLTIGSKGSDVEALQHYLNTHGFSVVATPTYAGSLGYETQYFGVNTQAALAEFQKSVGISPAVGYFGPITRAYVNAHE
jgi:hypothetical protein